jgi:hypothetical protein
MEFDTRAQFEKVSEALKKVTQEYKIYGIYKNGKLK